MVLYTFLIHQIQSLHKKCTKIRLTSMLAEENFLTVNQSRFFLQRIPLYNVYIYKVSQNEISSTFVLQMDSMHPNAQRTCNYYI